RRSTNTRLSLELLSKICVDLSRIEYNGRIVFSGYNEPLYDEIIFHWSKSLKSSCPKSIIIAFTNGDYLNNELIKECSANGIDRLNVDLYPPEGKERDKSEHLRSLRLFKQRTRLELNPLREGYFLSRVNDLDVIVRITTYDENNMTTR